MSLRVFLHNPYVPFFKNSRHFTQERGNIDVDPMTISFFLTFARISWKLKYALVQLHYYDRTSLEEFDGSLLYQQNVP